MDSTTEFTVMMKRIEKLERQNRRWRISAMLALLVLALSAIIAARPVNVQTAEKFIVADSSGGTLAILGPDTDGLPGLSIRDNSTGKERAWLGLWGQGKEVSLGFYDRNQKERSRLGILSDGTTRLNIDDDAGNLRAWLGQSGGGRESGVGFYDANARERAWLGIASGTTPRIILYNADHKETWTNP